MLFYFTIHTCQCQAASILVARATMFPSLLTQPSEPAVKLQKKGAASKVTGTFYHFMLFFSSLSFVFSCSETAV